MTAQGRLAGKVAIVTGSAAGIGRATAELFAREGAAVLVADLDASGAAAVAEKICEAGGKAAGCRVDVADEASVVAMITAAVERFGRLDVLHNNAGLTRPEYTSRDGSVVDLTVETFDWSIAVNLRGAMLGCKHAIPSMLASGGGSIINTSSNISRAGDLSLTAYAAAKGGVNALTMCVATQFGKQGIRCNALCPGLVLTDTARASCPAEVVRAIEESNLVARVGLPADLAAAALFLASDESAFVTGQIWSIDGGQLAHLPHFAALRPAGLTTTR